MVEITLKPLFNLKVGYLKETGQEPGRKEKDPAYGGFEFGGYIKFKPDSWSGKSILVVPNISYFITSPCDAGFGVKIGYESGIFSALLGAGLKQSLFQTTDETSKDLESTYEAAFSAGIALWNQTVSLEVGYDLGGIFTVLLGFDLASIVPTGSEKTKKEKSDTAQFKSSSKIKETKSNEQLIEEAYNKFISKVYSEKDKTLSEDIIAAEFDGALLETLLEASNHANYTGEDDQKIKMDFVDKIKTQTTISPKLEAIILEKAADSTSANKDVELRGLLLLYATDEYITAGSLSDADRTLTELESSPVSLEMAQIMFGFRKLIDAGGEKGISKGPNNEAFKDILKKNVNDFIASISNEDKLNEGVIADEFNKALGAVLMEAKNIPEGKVISAFLSAVKSHYKDSYISSAIIFEKAALSKYSKDTPDLEEVLLLYSAKLYMAGNEPKKADAVLKKLEAVVHSDDIKAEVFGLRMEIDTVLKKGTAAPDFTTSDIVTGKVIHLKEIVKKSDTTIVIFWGPFCPPCKPQLQTLTELQQKALEKLTIIGVSDDLTKEMIGNGIDHLPGLNVDPKDAIAIEKQYGVSGTPTMIIIDKKGNIKAMFKGKTDIEKIKPFVKLSDGVLTSL